MFWTVTQTLLGGLLTTFEIFIFTLLFALPLAVSFVPLPICGGVVCAVATLAAIQEGHFIRTGKVIE